MSTTPATKGGAEDDRCKCGPGLKCDEDGCRVACGGDMFDEQGVYIHATDREPHEWVERAPNVFAARIGVYEATVSDSDAETCWRWALEHDSERDPQIDAAYGFYVGDADGAKLRAERIAAILMQNMEAGS